MQNGPILICLKGDIINWDVQILYITYILDKVCFVGPFWDADCWPLGCLWSGCKQHQSWSWSWFPGWGRKGFHKVVFQLRFVNSKGGSWWQHTYKKLQNECSIKQTGAGAGLWWHSVVRNRFKHYLLPCWWLALGQERPPIAFLPSNEGVRAELNQYEWVTCLPFS